MSSETQPVNADFKARLFIQSVAGNPLWMLTLGTGTEFLLPQCQHFMVWASQLFLYKILFPFFLLFVCLLCSIKAQTLWSKLCFPDFLWSPEQRGLWWHTAVRIIGIVSVINQTSGWAGFCPVPTFFMDKQGRTQWDKKKKKKVRGLGLRVMPTLYLPNSKTKLLVKIRWSGKNYFFLAELGHAAEFLVRSTFLWAGCKDLKNGVYNGKADTM